MPRDPAERAVRLAALRMRVLREQAHLLRGICGSFPEHLSATALLAFCVEIEEISGDIRQLLPRMRNDLPPVITGRLVADPVLQSGLSNSCPSCPSW